MKSNKQRRKELAAARAKRAAKRAQRAELARAKAREEFFRSNEVVLVNPALLRPSTSYSTPDFVARGYYRDRPFTCKDCGKPEVWTATQQKWWYEVAKGDVFSGAARCRLCRRRGRERKAQARQTHLAGLARKRVNELKLVSTNLKEENA
jgi:hypothetical protein